MCVRVCRHKMSNWNTQLSISIEVYVELGKTANEICAMLSEACGTGNGRKSSVWGWHKQIEMRRENRRWYWTKRSLEITQMWWKCLRGETFIQTRPDSEPGLLYGNAIEVIWSGVYESIRILAQKVGFFIMTTLQLSQRSLASITWQNKESLDGTIPSSPCSPYSLLPKL